LHLIKKGGGGFWERENGQSEIEGSLSRLCILCKRRINYNAVLSKSISQDVSATKSLDELDKIMYIHIRIYIRIQVSKHEIYRYHYGISSYHSDEMSKC
jgi:hypothetical protein